MDPRLSSHPSATGQACCLACGGTILPPTIGGVPRGTCHCPREQTERFTDWDAATLGVRRHDLMTTARELFPLGRIVATPGLLAAFERNPGVGTWDYLRRHVTGDWGNLNAVDQAENELSLREVFRLLSAYELPDGTKFWIITEADRSATTLLLPDEY